MGQFRFRRSVTKAALLFCLLIAPAGRAGDGIPAYRQQPGVAGTINSVGSDTLNNLMTFWTEAFRAIYPNVSMQVEGKGSSTAPPALSAGAAQIGPMSRPMKASEIEDIEKKRGFKPTAIAVAIDCVAVYVNKDNPIAGLSLPQVDAVFSSTRKLGRTEVVQWGQLGLGGEWGARNISIYGRNAASGTYAFFKEIALGNGDYRNSVKEQPGSAAVVNGIAGDKAGIGYSGIGYKTSEVRALPVAPKDGGKFIAPNFENAIDGSYPLSRLLYVYILKDPGQPLPAAVREFMKYILSKEGQDLVARDGYGALPAETLQEQLALLGE
ncbi:MAG: PstS family phosphate ABC transporter substrate-binding protein [Planctomycetota bacterium]|jgi:phosphate transport system substrate-binding protein|nr:PstS family phosphate ABC transporter substrate-binding protein [Planctomycetota bacterium]